MRRRKVKGPKRVSYQLIDRDNAAGKPIYTMLRDIIEEHHEELADARIALAWCTSWKPDRDGRMTLGKCKKVSDLDKEFQSYDFIILLHRPFWYREEVDDEKRSAILDHELSHAAVTYDDRTGEPVYDERGRKVFRTRRHDLEEFSAVVERHGCYKADVEQFYRALRRSDSNGWKPCEACQDSPGYVAAGDGVSVIRCACWIAWRDRQQERDPAPAKARQPLLAAAAAP